jgi:hypothetical protein
MEKREKMRNDRGRKTVPPGSLAEQVDYGYPIKDMKQTDMWPTPSSRDYKGGSGTVKEKDGKYYRQSNKTGTKFGVRLDALVEYQEKQKMWPTPTQDMTTERKKKYAQGGKPLTMAVQEAEQKMFPTPAARDYKDTGENTDYEKLAKKSKLSGAVKSEMYPTPRGSEVAATITMEAALNRIEKTGYKANLEESVALREQKMFLTPGANEDAAGKPTGKMQRMLGNSPEVRNTGKGTLNPDWVEWLMGYPPGWTDITDLK